MSPILLSLPSSGASPSKATAVGVSEASVVGRKASTYRPDEGGARVGLCPLTADLLPDCGLCCHKHCRDRVKVECKRPVAKGDVSPPGAPIPPTPVPHTSCGKTQGVAALGRGQNGWG